MCVTLSAQSFAYYINKYSLRAHHAPRKQKQHWKSPLKYFLRIHRRFHCHFFSLPSKPSSFFRGNENSHAVTNQLFIVTPQIFKANMFSICAVDANVWRQHMNTSLTKIGYTITGMWKCILLVNCRWPYCCNRFCAHAIRKRCAGHPFARQALFSWEFIEFVGGAHAVYIEY